MRTSDRTRARLAVEHPHRPSSRLMLSARFKPYHVPLFLAKYAWLTARRRPVLVHFEVTMRCNARCGFCDYWKTPAEAKEHELKSFADAARFFNPMMVTFTGGEPTLRRDLEELVAAVSDAIRLKYITMITHGGMLTPERALVAVGRGHQPVQHLARLPRRAARHGARHPGPTDKIFTNVAAHARARHRLRSGSTPSSRTTTSIRSCRSCTRAAELGCGVNFSVYTDSKNGNTDAPRPRRPARGDRQARRASCSRSSGAGAASSRTPTTTSSRSRATSAAR